MKRAHHIRFAGKKIVIQCEPESCTFKSSLFVSMYLAMFSCSDISLSGILNSDIRYQISSYPDIRDIQILSRYLAICRPLSPLARSTTGEARRVSTLSSSLSSSLSLSLFSFVTSMCSPIHHQIYIILEL